MFRLLGFLIGSATAITVILLLLGIPDFHLTDRGIDQQRFDAVVEQLKNKQREVADVAEVLVDEVAGMADDVQDNIEIVTETLVPDIADDQLVIQTELQWYSFWNPFRSEIAARGFVSRLEKVTGLDYRVVKIKIGVYEVAFAYDDDMERRTKLMQISAATGLELPDS
ncbi:MAG: hypothetical protein IIA09_01995 [Proteobacteria bacterium]|nr:hypothetical protein [Pseudomonadota bacterium]